MNLVTWQVIIDLQDGIGNRDITSLVKDTSISRTRRLYNALKHSPSTVSFVVIHTTELAALLIAQKKDIILTMNRNGVAYFTGIIRPTYSIDIMESGAPGATISLEGVDNYYKLERIHGWVANQFNVSFTDAPICDPANTTTSVVHRILSYAHHTLTTEALPTISDTVSFVLESSRTGTTSSGKASAKDGTKYLEVLEEVLYEFGYCFYFDEIGVFHIYKWGETPSSIVPTSTITQKQIQKYTYAKGDNTVNRIDTSFTGTATNMGLVLPLGGLTVGYPYALIPITPATGTYTIYVGQVKLNALAKLRKVNEYYLTLCMQCKVGTNVQNQYYTVTRTHNPQLFYSYNGENGTANSITVNKIIVDNYGGVTLEYTATIQARRYPGDITFRFGEINVSYDYASEMERYSSCITEAEQAEPEKIDTKYISTALQAQTLADRVLEYKVQGSDTYSMKANTEYEIGEYIEIVEPINGIVSGKGRIVEISDDSSYPYETLSYNYKIDPIGGVTVVQATNVTGSSSVVERVAPPDPIRQTATNNVIQIPPESPTETIVLPAQYIYWNDKLKQLEISGDMFLKGNSTVQGKIAVGGQLSSTIYNAGSAGWAIKADGNAEFFNIKLRGTVDAVGATLGGFTISSNALYAGTGSSRIQLDTTQGIHMGATTFGAASFSVTLAGALKATSGLIGGFTLGEYSLTAGYSGNNISIASNQGIFLGGASFSVSLFSVSLTGELIAKSGKIGGFTIGTDRLESSGTGTARIILNQEYRRVEVVDSSNVTKVAMGYLNGLPRNDIINPGYFGPSDYGFWARSGDKLRIDGAAEYSSGDWIIKSDASYQILDGITPSIVRARMGTISGDKGFFVNEANYNADPSLITNYTTRLTESTFFVGNKDAYIRYNSGVLTLNLVTFLISSLATNLKGTFYASNKTGSTVSDSNFSTHAIGITTDTGGTYGIISHAGAITISSPYTIIDSKNQWSGLLRLGGNGDLSTNTLQSIIQSTTGNLHLDAGAGKAIYLNYYNNTADISHATLLLANGNVLLGTGSDVGRKLNVAGDAMFTGNVQLRGIAELLTLVNDSAYIPFYNTAANTRNGYIQFNTTGSSIIQADTNHIAVNPGSSYNVLIGGVISNGYKTQIIQDMTMDSDTANAQFCISGKTSQSKRLIIGYDTSTSNGFGFIKSGNASVAWTNLALQPTGGNVTLGTSTDLGYRLNVNGTVNIYNGEITLGANIQARAHYTVLNQAGDGWNTVISRTSTGKVQLQNVDSISIPGNVNGTVFGITSCGAYSISISSGNSQTGIGAYSVYLGHLSGSNGVSLGDDYNTYIGYNSGFGLNVNNCVWIGASDSTPEYYKNAQIVIRASVTQFRATTFTTANTYSQVAFWMDVNSNMTTGSSIGVMGNFSTSPVGYTIKTSTGYGFYTHLGVFIFQCLYTDTNSLSAGFAIALIRRIG